MRSIFLTIVLLSAGWLFSCDDGKIYPKEEVVSGRQVDASFVFEHPETFPESEYYQVVFAAFEKGGIYPLSFKKLSKPAAGENVSLTLSNIPDNADFVSISLLDKGKKLICHLYDHSIAGVGEETVTIPQQSVSLMSFGRVQSQLFTVKCIACHGGSSITAVGLNLTEGHSYDALVGVESVCAGPMKCIEAGSTSQSFIMKVLTDREVLGTDHTEFVNEDDIQLLRSWITTGCEK